MCRREALKVLGRNLRHGGFLPSGLPCVDESLRLVLLGMSEDPRGTDLFRRIFPPDYEPGTHTLGERRVRPGFIAVEDQASLEDWVLAEAEGDLRSFLGSIGEASPALLARLPDASGAPELVLEALTCCCGGGAPLADEVYQQEYTDVIRRILSILLTGWPRLPFNEYDRVNVRLRKLGLDVVRRAREATLHEAIRISVLSGLVGLNFKRNASATARLYSAGSIPFDFDEDADRAAAKLLDVLLARAQGRSALDCEDAFLGELLGAAGNVSLVLLPDDLFETVLDLRVMELLLDANPQLRVTILPRAVTAGNDASYSEVVQLVKEFPSLEAHCRQDRCRIHPAGPLSGVANGWRMSRECLLVLEQADVVYAKGARSCESLQGLCRSTYYAFSVCRSISESTTGIDAETGAPVLLRQASGQRTFRGFRMRHTRPAVSASGRTFFLSEQTTRDVLDATGATSC